MIHYLKKIQPTPSLFTEVLIPLALEMGKRNFAPRNLFIYFFLKKKLFSLSLKKKKKF